METFNVLLLEGFYIFIMYCAILPIFSDLNAWYSLFNVELTDFDVICAVIFVTKRVSKFIKCSYVVLLYCVILLIFFLTKRVSHFTQC